MKKRRVSITLNENLLEEMIRVKELLQEETGVTWSLSSIASVAIRDFIERENLLEDVFKRRSKKEKEMRKNEST